MWDVIKFYWSQAYQFLLPFIKILMSQIGEALTKSAIAAVKTAQESGLDNAGKRDLAFQQIASDMAEAGFSIAASVINLALEAAVTKLKSTN